MATFFVLPPRSCLEEALESLFSRLVPGLPIPAESWDITIERIAAAANWPSDLFFVPRDELPDGEPLAEALCAGFGAEPGDRVVEVSLSRGPAAARTWVLPRLAVSNSAAAH